MGLSASQTRFLTLTARKSNVEYQGQQINQARTALANQTSQLYTQLMNLDAPTAPSIYQYVINPAKAPNINWSDTNAYPLSDIESENFFIYYAGNKPAFQDFNIPEYVEQFDEDGKSIGWAMKSTDEDGNTVYGNVIANKEDIPGTYCTKEKGIDGAGNKKEYTAIHVSKNENFTYNPLTDMFDAKDDDISSLPNYIQAYNSASSYYNTYSKPIRTPIYKEGTDLTPFNDNVTTNDPSAVAYENSRTVNYDQAQYNAAMVKYEDDLKKYEKTLDEINAKTEEIHQADKKLELQLKQLDTEQEAIQTEYEAVQKVINKNIENTFKSFA